MLQKVDWHIHSIDHKYYYDATFERLTEEDKRKIRYTVHWAEERGLNYAAITDHDLAASGMYAAEYARAEALQIKIIPGIECEVLMRDNALPPVHILGLGVKEQPEYFKSQSVAAVIEAIHKVGGIAVMAHPMAYPSVFWENRQLLDGVEVFNGTRAHVINNRNQDIWSPDPNAGHFDPGDDFKGLRLYGSDKHYKHSYMREHNQSVSKHSQDMVEEIINGKYRKE